MKKRPALRIEQLEARETPDVSLCHAPDCPIVPLPAQHQALEHDPLWSAPPPSAVEQLRALDPVTAARLLAEGSASSPPHAFSFQALETVFSERSELEEFLARSSETLPEAASTRDSADSQPAHSVGWQYLHNYVRKAIRNEELRRGPLPDHEDIVQEVFVEWREMVGSGEEAFANLLDRDSAERQTLRKTVRRVLDHLRYEQHRGERRVELTDQPAPNQAAKQEWIDLQLDWAQGVGQLDPRERQTLELRRAGWTFEEIGLEIGLVKQRVAEVFHSAVSRLQEVYCL